MTGLKRQNTEIVQMWALIIATVVVLIISAVIFMYFFTQNRDNPTLEVYGRANTNFHVHYLENHIFPDNPVPANLHFLMALTDFIEVNSSFRAEFSEEVDVHYSYVSSKRLAIRLRDTADDNLNPVVFEMDFPLSEITGNTFTDMISFSAADNSNGPGGSYIIFPSDYMDIYRDFIALHAEKVLEENAIVRNARGFSAELFIDFVYDINIPAWGISESATQGYRLSLSAEGYSFVATGNPTFSHVFNSAPTASIPLPIAIVFVMILSACLFFLFRCIKRLEADPNKYRQEASAILKKYANEIIVSDEPLQLSHYAVVYVNEFDALLKLAINLNKHITCFQSNKQSEFAVIVDEQAYYFNINYV